jgi:plastocyanin
MWLSPLDAASSKASPTAQHGPYRLVQKDKQFTPHLLVVPTGSSVDFPNMDPFFHNVFSLFNGRRFDLGLYEAGANRSVRFDREGVSYIFCNIHPEIGAVVLSLNTPFYGVSRTGGLVTINGVPPGNYRLNVWSEQAETSSLSDAEGVVHVASENVHWG